METYAEEHLPQMEADVRAMFAKQGLQVPEGFQFFPEGLHKYDPAFLGSYYRKIGFTDGYADRVASDAAEMRKGAAAAAKAAIDKTHFSYEYSNADALVKKVFPFHYWMSRATVLYGESLMRNPFALLVFTKMADELRHTDTDSPGFNARQKFWIRLMSTHHGFNLLMNPDALLGVTHALGMFDGYSPEGETEIGKVRRWMQGAGLTMFPWIDGALNMAGLYGNTFEPDLLGIRHRALVGAAVNALLAEEGKGPGPSPYADLSANARGKVSKWVSSFAPGWMAQPVPPVQDGNIQSANLDKQIENQILTNNPGMVGFRYLRVRMTSYSSGTASGVLVLYSSAPQVVSVGGAINVTPIVAQSNNSLVAFRLASAATTNATSVKASAGRVYRTILSNPSAAIKYVKFYNKASAPTVGTDTPVATIALAANGGTYVTTEDIGWYFSTGIAFAITGAAADSDTTAVAANDVFVTLNYI